MTEFSGNVAHLEDVESPWANAGGVIKTIDELDIICRTGIGWAEDGSHAFGDPAFEGKRLGNAIDLEHPELGEQYEVLWYDEETDTMWNSLGMPGPGFENMIDEVPERVEVAEGHGKKYVLNVAPVSEDPASETAEMVQRGYEKGAHAVLVNGGCPNVVLEDGGRKELLSRNPEKLKEVLLTLKPIVVKHKPVLVRLSPMQSYEQARQIYQVIIDSGVVSGVFVPNTWPEEIPVDEHGNKRIQVNGNVAGKSGPSTADAAAEQSRWALKLLKGNKIDVIDSGGIKNGAELRRRLGQGAVAGAGTTFFYRPENGWAEDTDKILNDLAEAA